MMRLSAILISALCVTALGAQTQRLALPVRMKADTLSCPDAKGRITGRQSIFVRPLSKWEHLFPHRRAIRDVSRAIVTMRAARPGATCGPGAAGVVIAHDDSSILIVTAGHYLDRISADSGTMAVIFPRTAADTDTTAVLYVAFARNRRDSSAPPKQGAQQGESKQTEQPPDPKQRPRPIEPTKPLLLTDSVWARNTLLFDRDLAVVIVPRTRHADEALQNIPRLAAVSKLRDGDRLYSIGCPSECWQSSTDERFLAVSDVVIVFRTFSVGDGSSGGALFNEWGELVGIIRGNTEIQFGEGVATRGDSVKALLDRPKETHDRLKLAWYPRGGYERTIGSMVMIRTRVPSSGSPSAKLTRGARTGLPSFRATYESRMSWITSWHVGGEQLFSDSTALRAFVAGAGLSSRHGPLRWRLSAEGAVGNVEATVDSTIAIFSEGAPTADRVLWQPVTEQASGIGVGLGGDLTLPFVRPFNTLIIEGLVMYRRFAVRSGVPGIEPWSSWIGLRIHVGS